MQRTAFLVSVRSLIRVVLLSIVVMTSCSRYESPIRVAVNPWPGYAMLFLADELDLFKQEGVEVRLLELTSLGDVRRTYESGRADLMACTLIECLLASQEDCPAILHVADYSNGADVLLVSPAISDLTELLGARIGFEPSTLDAVHLHAALAQVGLTLADVEPVPLHASDKVEAFRSGHVDAVQCYPPDSTNLLSSTDAKSLFDSSQIPDLIIDVLAARESWVQVHPVEAASIRRAYCRACNYYLQNPDTAVSIMARRLGITADEFREAMQGIAVVTPEQQPDYLCATGKLIPAIKLTCDGMKSMAMLPSEFTPDPLVRAVSYVQEGAP